MIHTRRWLVQLATRPARRPLATRRATWEQIGPPQTLRATVALPPPATPRDPKPPRQATAASHAWERFRRAERTSRLAEWQKPDFMHIVKQLRSPRAATTRAERALARNRAANVLEAMMAHPRAGTPRLVDFVMLAQARQDTLDGAGVRKMLADMAEAGVRPDTAFANLLARCLLRRQDSDGLCQLVDEALPRLGVEPDAVTFGCLLASYARRLGSNVEANSLKVVGQLDLAAATLEQMRARGLAPTPAFWRAVLFGLGQVAAQARPVEHVLDAMRRGGTPPDYTSYKTLIDGFDQRDLLPAAQRLYACMKADGLAPPTLDVFRLLVDGHRRWARAAARSGDGAAAAAETARYVEALVDDVAAAGLEPDLRLFGALMDAAAKAAAVAFAERLYADVWRCRLVPDRAILTSLVETYGRAGDQAMVRALWDALADRDLVDGPMVAVVLDACGWNGAVHDARDIWAHLVRDPSRRRLITENVCNSYIEALARNTALAEAKAVLFSAMDIGPLPPLSSSAWWASPLVRLPGIAPSFKTFRTLLSFLHKHGYDPDIRDVLGLVRERFPRHLAACRDLLRRMDRQSSS